MVILTCLGTETTFTRQCSGCINDERHQTAKMFTNNGGGMPLDRVVETIICQKLR